MDRKKYQNIIVGAVVLVALFLLVFGMAFLNEFSPGQKLDHYFFIAKEVGLLTRDDPVKFNGVKQGKVVDIILLDDSRVKVEVQVKAGFPIREGSRVKIQNVGLMGERMINIAVNPTGKIVTPGSTMDAGYDYGIAETMGAAGELVEQAKGMVDKLQGVMDSTVGRPQFTHDVNAIVRRVDEITARLDKVVKDVDPKVRGTVDDLQATGRTARQVAEKAAPAVERITGKAEKMTDETQELLGDLRKISTDLKTLSEKTRNGQGTVGKLMNDDAFYKDLNKTMKNADSLINHIQKKGLDVNVDLF
ncbi:MAG: hypothetical protein RL318_738 [Fibrobacterota bacterium]|jgi:phospholipid/cholesterol/gamma-HCH transport system substrate-binding protein